MTYRIHPLQAELSRLLEAYLAPPRPGGHQTAPHKAELDRDAWTPPVDIYETAEEMLVLVDVPGVDTSKIDLSITGAVLTIRGNRLPDEFASAVPTVRERASGAFQRMVEVSTNIDVDAIQAKAQNGVLTIRLPKRTAGNSRTIPIRTA